VPVLPTDDESASSVEVASHASRVLKNFTYCSVNRLALLADIYFPKNASGVGPLLIYVHGGAWSSGSKDSGSGFAEIPALLDAGYTVAAVNYRLAPNYKMPAMIEDVKCAVRSFRAHAAEYGFDPERIGVWGGSAGGHLVSMLGVADKSAGFDVGEYLEYSSRVQAVVDMFGPADLTSSDFNTQQQKNSGKNVFGTTDLANPIFAAVSPVTHITSDDPPFLILQGDIDTTVPLSQSQLFYDRLRAAGVDAQLVIVKGGPHGLGSPRQIPSRMELTQMIVKFFQKKLK
jgi:acetyl esterase/lipase